MATIAAGRTAATVTPGVDITSRSFVLLTAQSDPGSRRLWYTLNATDDRLTVRCSSAAPVGGLKVTWLLLER